MRFLYLLMIVLASCSKDSSSVKISQSSEISYSLNPSSIVAGQTIKVSLVKTESDGTTTSLPNYNFSYSGNELSVFNNLKNTSIYAYKVGQYQLSAINNLDQSEMLVTANVVAGPAFKLMLGSGNNQSSVINSSLPQPLSVKVVDKLNNPVPNYQVTWNITKGTGSLSSSSSLTNANGDALIQYQLGTNPEQNIIEAHGSSLSNDTNVSFKENAVGTDQMPTRLKFVVNPSSAGIQNLALSQQPKVAIQDKAGNVILAGSFPIIISAYKNNSCSTLASGMLSSNIVNSQAGLATFTDIKYSAAEKVYFKASSGSLVSECTTGTLFNSAPLTAQKLAFFIQPLAGVQNKPFLVQTKVLIQDANDQIVSPVAIPVTLQAYSDNQCKVLAPGSLSGSATLASLGSATFSSLSYNGSGTIYLKATADSLGSACSLAISVSADTTNIAKKLKFASSPVTISQYVLFDTAPTVAIMNDSNSIVSTGSYPITLAAFSDSSCLTPASGSLSADSLTVAASSGTARFTGVHYIGSGPIYLKASASTLPSICSQKIIVNDPTPGTAIKLVFAQQPTDSIKIGNPLPSSPVVQAKDINNSTVVTKVIVSLGIYSDQTCSTLVSTLPVTSFNNSDSLTVSNLSFAQAGTYYIKASSGILQSACSSGITVYTPLSISQNTVAVHSGESKDISSFVSGGKPPYIYTVSSSIGSQVSSLGNYTAGTNNSSNNVAETVQIRDQFNDLVSQPVTILAQPVTLTAHLSNSNFTEGQVLDPIFSLEITGSHSVTKITSTSFNSYFTTVSIEKDGVFVAKQLAQDGSLVLPANNGSFDLDFGGAVKFAQSSATLSFDIQIDTGQIFHYDFPISIAAANKPYMKYDIFVANAGSIQGSTPQSLMYSIKEVQRLYSGWRTPIFVRLREGEINCQGTVISQFDESNMDQKNCTKALVSADAETAFFFSTAWDGSDQIGGVAHGIRNGVIIESRPWMHTLAHELGHNFGLWHTFETSWNKQVSQSDSAGYYYRGVYKATRSDSAYYGQDWANSIAAFDGTANFNFGSIVDDTPTDGYGGRLVSLYDPNEFCVTVLGRPLCHYPNNPYHNGDQLVLFYGQDSLSVCQEAYNPSILNFQMSCSANSGIAADQSSIVNVMSYWIRVDGTSQFTAGQKARMDAVLGQYPILTTQ